MIAFSVLLFLPFLYFMIIYYQSYDLLRRAEGFNIALATQLYDINGLLISELYEENRNYTDIAKIPDHVRKAFLAAEDQHFYTHTGIDLPGVLRALLVDIFTGDIRQGGSTITQQLVKQLYTGSEKSFRRKIIELLLAYKFEKRLSKDKILEMYLNQIYFGNGVYGIGAAARYYFNCDVERLNVVQAAILAGIPSAPNRFSPVRNPRAAYERSKQVLHNMITAGFVEREDVIETFGPFWEQYTDDISTRYHTLGVRNIASNKAPHFTEYIRQILIDRYGKDRVYRGGLKVYTTLDLRYQEAAQALISEATERQNRISMQSNRYKLRNINSSLMRSLLSQRRIPPEERGSYTSFLTEFSDVIMDSSLLFSLLFSQAGVESRIQGFMDHFEDLRQEAMVEGALVAISPFDGAIVTMVGGSEFTSINQLNRAIQARRQPGSSFKPFVFAAGIEYKLMTAATAFLDAPIVFRGRRKFWTPSNYDKSYYGMVLARRALAYSLNIVSVLIYELVGGDRIVRVASRLIQIPRSRFEVDPTMALGTTELTPLEMATGFAAFANGGKTVRPYAIRYITDRSNKKIYEPRRSAGEQVIAKETAFIMTSLLREVVDHGTATNAIRNVAGFSLPAAGKTGTNTKFRDAWFVGYTPDLVAAVWLGCDSQNYILGSGQSAAVVAAPVWGKFMKEVYTYRKVKTFGNPPPGIDRCRICTKSGLLPTAGCPVKQEFFIQGTQPTQTCSGQHSEMISVFDLVKRNKRKLLEKMKAEISSDGESADAPAE
ncbi:MAG: PBP1A family penicillin-binding protein [Spirochaetes bacterium]|nr:PBP1A family penicillin-binding protein [Spirochaetota bacterium]